MDDFRCTCPWDSLTVWVDGSVSHCGRTEPLGNLATQSFEEFWNSPKLQRLRGLFRHDALLEAGCMPTCNILMSKRPDEFVPNQIRTRDVDPVPEEAIQPEATSRLPTYMLLQLSDFCSLGCRMCCYGDGTDLREKFARSRTLDTRVFDHLRSVWSSIEVLEILGGELFDLPFDGHPLKRLFADLRELGSPHLKLKIVTNGKNLDARWATWLLQYEFVDSISFSLDSADPAIYPTIRIRGSLERSLENLSRIVNMREQRGHARPRVLVTALLGNHTAPGLLHLAEVAEHLGADRLDIQPMNPMGEARYHYDNNIFQERFGTELTQLWSDLVRLDFPSNRADILGMIESFLSMMGSRDEAVRTTATIPQFGQYRADQVVGPLVRGTEIVQPFIARREKLECARLVFATHMRTNTKPIEVRIEGPDARIIARAKVRAENLRDNAWHDVRFPETRIEPGVEYRVHIRSPRSRGTNCVSLRSAPAATLDLWVGGTRRHEQLALMLF